MFYISEKKYYSIYFEIIINNKLIIKLIIKICQKKKCTSLVLKAKLKNDYIKHTHTHTTRSKQSTTSQEYF